MLTGFMFKWGTVRLSGGDVADMLTSLARLPLSRHNGQTRRKCVSHSEQTHSCHVSSCQQAEDEKSRTPILGTGTFGNWTTWAVLCWNVEIQYIVGWIVWGGGGGIWMGVFVYNVRANVCVYMRLFVCLCSSFINVCVGSFVCVGLMWLSQGLTSFNNGPPALSHPYRQMSQHWLGNYPMVRRFSRSNGLTSPTGEGSSC